MEKNWNTKKVKLIGRSGRMGQVLSNLIDLNPEFILVEEDEDLVIDFSTPEGTKAALERNRPLVCGTTGLSEEICAQMEALSQKVPIVYSSNFSIGITLLSSFLKTLPKNLCQIEIEETHHKNKIDSPSGTALHLAQILSIDPKNIIAKRQNNEVGIHQVFLEWEKESLTLTHKVTSRKVFAQGALHAAKYILKKPAKLYNFADILVETNTTITR